MKIFLSNIWLFLKKRFVFILLILLVAAIPAAVFITISIIGQQQPVVNEVTSKSASSLKIDVPENNALIPAWKSISISKNSTRTNVDFYNPEENTDRYNLTFTLIMADTGEVLYQSGFVAPGEHITSINFPRKFSKGEYNLVLRAQPYNIDDNETQLNILDTNVVMKVV